jgi:hypothetical protein
MQNFITKVLVSMILLASPALHAQQLLSPKEDTVRWDYKRIENRVRSETVAQGGYFISYGGKSFLWVQDGVDRQYHFKTKSLQGDWRDSRKIGEMVYRVSCNGEEGTLRLIRQGRNFFVELNFLNANKRTPHLMLLVTSINKV